MSHHRLTRAARACLLPSLLSVIIIASAADVSSSSSADRSSPASTTTLSRPMTVTRQQQQQPKRCGKVPFEQCTFVDNMTYLNRKRWMVHHGNYNGIPFANWWSKHQVRAYPGWGKIALGIGNTPKHGKPYAGSQVLSRRWFGYGCYQVRMKPISVPGVLSTFFIYTGKFDAAPGRPKTHAEIDIEFVYRRQLGRIALQSNYFTNSTGYNEQFHFPKDVVPQDGFHNYGFKFTKEKIEWYADGKLIRTARKNIPSERDGPFRIFMNVWVAGPKAYLWAGFYKHRKGIETIYDKIKYTRGHNCKIRETF